MSKKDEKARTKGEALVEFVLNRYNYSKTNMADRHAKWKEYYDDYRGTASDTKEDWQANYVVTSLKEAVRTKTPIHMNILFPSADPSKSFDIKPGEESDEAAIPNLKDIITYQLGNVGKDRGGLFNVVEGHIKQFEIYGYSLTEQPWVEKKEKSKTVFEGPEIIVRDIFNAFPDPIALDVNKSWIVLRTPDAFVSRLRQLETDGIYHSVIKLKETSQPGSSDTVGENKINTDRVELLEYHGEVPKSLLEGKIHDDANVSPYEDEYVKALITIANREVCIRNDEYPYKCGNIFADASKDKMPNEQFGVGTGEDIQSYAAELTNAHNKLSDCINIISNPMGIINQQMMAGVSGGIIITHPGKMFFANQNVDDVRKAMMFIDTTAQAASLTPLIAFIQMLEEKIQKTTQAVPVISAMPTKEGLPDTLGATRMMQGNAAEPIKHIVKHCLEPWFQKVLEIFYKHDIQFFSKETAYKVLGKEKGAQWEQEKDRKEIKKEDINLAGNPDFIPQGVSVFEEKQVELQNLLKLTEIAPLYMKPAYDPMGKIQMGQDGKPVMEPVFSLEEIAKRVGESMNFSDLEELIPGLKEERERKEAKLQQKQTTNQAEKSTSASAQQTGAVRGTPPPSIAPAGNVPQGNVPIRGGR